MTTNSSNAAKRKLLKASFALGAATVLPNARAQAAYPVKPIKIVIGYQVGGPTDLTARLLANKLHSALGQPVVVENKPGAGGNIANEAVALAPPDGYTLLLGVAPITWNQLIFKNLKYDVLKSYEPVVNVMSAPSILAVSTKLGVNNLKELIELAKRNPGKLTYASSGIGGSQHMAGEQLKQRAGIDLVHVPYKGAAPALTDLISGTVDMAFMTSITAVPQLRTGNPRPIAVASPKRMVQLPNVPTIDELGLKDFEADSWNGLFAPAKTPPEIVARLNAEVNKILALPEVRDNFVSQGGGVVGGSSAEFGRYLQREVAQWTELLKTVKVTMD